jgi:hypothetical protein
MFYPVAFIYLLFFVKNPSLLGEQRLWTYDYTDSNGSGSFVTALAFNLSYFRSSFVHLICNQIIDYFSYHNLLQVDVIWFMCFPYLMYLILRAAITLFEFNEQKVYLLC